LNKDPESFLEIMAMQIW